MNIFDEFERHAVRRGFSGLRDQLRTAQDQDDEVRRRASLKRMSEKDDQSILRQYAAMGIEPIYGMGGLVSPALAMKLGHAGLHVGVRRGMERSDEPE